MAKSKKRRKEMEIFDVRELTPAVEAEIVPDSRAPRLAERARPDRS
jgi:hypothetical protein